MEPTDGFLIVAELEQGIDGARIEPLAKQLGLSLKEAAGLLAVAERTLLRLRNTPRLDKAIAEQVVLLEHLAVHGLDVFDGNTAVFKRWLRYPLAELNNQPPLDWLTTVTGIHLVDDVLTRIEYGVYV